VSLLQVIQDGRQALGEHLLADRARQLGQEEAADAGEAGVVVGEARPLGELDTGDACCAGLQ
jgi:hypothetical protein